MTRDNVNSVWQRFQDRINMTSSELDAWADSDNYDEYASRKNPGQQIDEPRRDVQRLLNTPKSEWKDSDSDGFNEVKEANEVLSFTSRMREVEQGDPMPGTDPELSKRDASLLNWGFDPNEGRDFVGDRPNK